MKRLFLSPAHPPFHRIIISNAASTTCEPHVRREDTLPKGRELFSARTPTKRVMSSLSFTYDPSGRSMCEEQTACIVRRCHVIMASLALIGTDLATSTIPPLLFSELTVTMICRGTHGLYDLRLACWEEDQISRR
jgi:hypothetical protein